MSGSYVSLCLCPVCNSEGERPPPSWSPFFFILCCSHCNSGWPDRIRPKVELYKVACLSAKELVYGLTWFGEIYSYFCFRLGPARAVLSRICIPLATPLHSETLVCHIKCLFIEQFCHPVCRCTMLGPHYTPSWSGQSVGQTERDRGNKSARCVSSFFLLFPPLPSSSSSEHFLSLWQRAMTSMIMISHRSSPAKKFDWWDRCIQEVFDIEPFLSIPWRYIFISIISDTYWWINVLVTCVQFSYDKSDFVPMKMYLHIMCICSSSLLHV